MTSPRLADRILHFLSHLHIPTRLPAKVEVMNPFLNAETWKWCTLYYQKFYNDNRPRTMMLGINPGRLGAGLTGIPFTDPIRLEALCGVPNTLPKKPELSAEFMHLMMEAAGGLEVFNSRVYISSLSPLGFIKDGRNMNYYDDPVLQKKLKPFMVQCLKDQIAMGMNTDMCFCLGEDKNYKFLHSLNEDHGFFQRIIPLPHPRFVMQYRRKKIHEYIDRYVAGFALAKA